MRNFDKHLKKGCKEYYKAITNTDEKRKEHLNKAQRILKAYWDETKCSEDSETRDKRKYAGDLLLEIYKMKGIIARS